MGASHDATDRPEPRISALTILALIVCLVSLLALQTVKFAGWVGAAWPKRLIDFDAFYIVAQLIQRGELDQAYAFATMGPLQQAASGGETFMPWTYPPPFDLVVGPLALLPIWLAYLVFTGATLTAFLLVIRAIDPTAYGAALLAMMPTLIITVTCGQNGFLTASLVGLACLALSRRSGVSGLPLGMMAVKPHLALGLALYVLATRQWRSVILAAITALILGGLATLVFGPSVWDAFLHGVGEARIFLAKGLYPMYRMVSAYAFLLTLGLPSGIAFAGQILVAGLAITGVGLAFRRGAATRQLLGLTLLSGLMLSPYVYDYDLPIAAIGLTLLLPDLWRLTGRRERAVLLVLSWVSCGWGLLLDTAYSDMFDLGLPETQQPLSLGGATFCLLVIAVSRILARDRPPAAVPVAVPGALGIAA